MDNEPNILRAEQGKVVRKQKNFALDFMNVNCEPNMLLDKEKAQNRKLVRFDFVNFVQFYDHFLQLIH